MKKTLYLLLCLVALVSCKNKQGHVGIAAGEKVTMQDGLPVIDLQKEYPKDTIALQEIADLEYIPLETNENALMQGLHNLYMDDQVIITTTLRTGDIILFDRKGKHLSTFNHKGQGGTDYLQVYHSVTVDSPKKEIFVFDWRPGNSSSIKVYSFDGKYLRTLPLPVNWKACMYNYDAEHLLLEDYGEVDGARKPRYVNLTPYCLVSKQTGQVEELPIQLTERMRDRLTYRKKIEQGVMSFVLSFNVYPMAKSGDKVMIADFTSDTIYTYRKNKLTPFALKTNRITSFESTIIAGPVGWSDRYLFLETQDKRTKEEINMEVKVPGQGEQVDTPDSHLLLYDQKEEIIKDVILNDVNYSTENKKNPRMYFAGYELSEGCFMLAYRPDQLLEKLEKGELKGELAELAKTLQEDDNPVLVLVKFKE